MVLVSLLWWARRDSNPQDFWSADFKSTAYTNSATRPFKLKVLWRHLPDLNRCTRFCRPLPNHSAKAPPLIYYNTPAQLPKEIIYHINNGVTCLRYKHLNNSIIVSDTQIGWLRVFADTTSFHNVAVAVHYILIWIRAKPNIRVFC